MSLKKRFALTVAKQTWTSERPIIVAHIPWDQFEATGGPGSYARIIEREGADAVIVSRSPYGKWASETKIGKAWAAICQSTPIDSLKWDTMAVEADCYPWEQFQR